MTNQFERSDVRVVVRGGLTDGAAGYAQDKMVGVLDRIAEPVLFAELKLEMATDPARPRPATVEAVVDLDGHPVRAKVAARVMHEAVDLVMDALERRIRRYEDRLHRAARPVHPTPHEWRHGDLPEHRPDYFRRPAEEREHDAPLGCGDFDVERIDRARVVHGLSFTVHERRSASADRSVQQPPSG